MWTTVFFDLDGTLTDSGEGITKSVQYALRKEFGIDVPDISQLNSFVGPPLKEQFMAYTGCDEARGERAVETFREYFRPIGIFENRPYPGIPTMLSQLKEEGLSLVLTSSKPEGFCRIILEHFGMDNYFSAIVGSEMDGSRTAKPDVIREALRRMGLNDRRGEVVMVGDKLYDLLGARECGIEAIGVTYGYGSREELEGQGAVCLVDSPTELRNVLIGQKRAAEQSFAAIGTMGRVATGHRPLFMVWRVLYPILLFYGLQIALAVVASLLLDGVLYRFINLDTYDKLWNVFLNGLGTTVIADAIVAMAAYMCYMSDERVRKLRGGGSLVPGGFRLPDILGIVCASVLATTIVSYVVSAFQIRDEAFEEANELMYSNTPLPLLFVGIVILAPLAEELVLRGLVYRRVRDYAGVPLAICLSALIFGAIHGNLVQGVYGFLMGCFMALIYEHFGTLWATIAVHMSNNLLAFIGVKLPTDGPAVDIYNYVTLGIMFLGLVYLIYLFTRSKRVNVV